MAVSDEPTVATTSGAHMEMTPLWDMVDNLLGGTLAMRAAGERYLPRFDGESKKNYDARLHRSVLTSYFKRALRHLSAKPFTYGVSVDDLPVTLEDIIFDADLQGNNLHVFAHRLFREGTAKGLSHILVDFPEGLPDGATKEDERRANRRPYFVRVAPENLIAAYAEMIGGEETLTHVRIRENEIVKSGWGEKLVQRIRVLERGTWQLYELQEDKRKEQWVLTKEGETSLDVIPLTTFYAGRTGFMTSDPPLQDVAHLNVAHWQSASDQRNILTVSRFPILAATGVTAQSVDSPVSGDDIKIGPFQVLRADDPSARFYYVEHAGAAVQAGRQDLEDLREQMAILSAESMLKTQTGNATATQRAIDKAESNSALEQMVMDLEDTLNNALSFANMWTGGDFEDEAGKTKLSRDFARTTAPETDIVELIKLRMSGELTRETLFKEMVRRGVLADDFDIDGEIEKTRNGIDDMPAHPAGGAGAPGSEI